MSFSNVEGSNLSSLGKYEVTSIVGRMRIGEECIILNGVESTNSNARKRQILIHSYKDVYYNPGIYPFNVFRKSLSHGCFVINKHAFKKTKRIAKPIGFVRTRRNGVESTLIKIQSYSGTP